MQLDNVAVVELHEDGYLTLDVLARHTTATCLRTTLPDELRSILESRLPVATFPHNSKLTTAKTTIDVVQAPLYGCKVGAEGLYGCRQHCMGAKGLYGCRVDAGSIVWVQGGCRRTVWVRVGAGIIVWVQGGCRQDSMGAGWVQPRLYGCRVGAEGLYVCIQDCMGAGWVQKDCIGVSRTV